MDARRECPCFPVTASSAYFPMQNCIMGWKARGCWRAKAQGAYVYTYVYRNRSPLDMQLTLLGAKREFDPAIGSPARFRFASPTTRTTACWMGMGGLDIQGGALTP